MGRRYLRRNVTIRGKGYGPAYGNAYTVPEDVAALIHEDAWATEPDRPAKQKQEQPQQPRRRKSGGKS